MKRAFVLLAIFMVIACPQNADATRWPLSNGSTPDILTSCFGPRNWSTWFHHGFDLRAQTSLPVYNVEYGHVFAVGWSNSLGNYVIVWHDYAGHYTWFYHLEDYIVEPDEEVSEGELIGNSGNTPNVEYHLHLGYSDYNWDNRYGMHPNDPNLELPSTDYWYPEIDDTDPWNFIIYIENNHIMAIDFLVTDYYDIPYGRADFLSIDFHIYHNGQWHEDNLHFNNFPENNPSHYFNVTNGEVYIDALEFDPDGWPDNEHEVCFYWAFDTPVPYVPDAEVGYLALEANDFDYCPDWSWGCAWGNIWHTSPQLIIENFAGVETTDGVALSWDSYLSRAIGFNVYRAQNDRDGEYSKLNEHLISGVDGDNPPSVYSFVDTAITSGFEYFYKLESVDEHGESRLWDSHIITVEIGAPTEFEITEIYPNPFNSRATISYKLNGKHAGQLNIVMYDICGRLVKILRNETVNPGEYLLTFDGLNKSRNAMASGIYFIRMSWGEQRAIKPITLIK